MVHEQVCDGDALIRVAERGVAQIQHIFGRALLLQRLESACDLLRATFGQRERLNVAGGCVCHPRVDRRDDEIRPLQRDLLRLCLRRLHHCKIDRRTNVTGQHRTGFCHRQIARCLTANSFENIARLDACVIRRTARQHRNHCRVSEALRDHDSDLRGGRFALLESRILFGRHVARFGIERFEQSVQCPTLDLGELGFFDVVAADVR